MTDHIDEIIDKVQREFGPVSKGDGYALLRTAAVAAYTEGHKAGARMQGRALARELLAMPGYGYDVVMRLQEIAYEEGE